METSAVYEKSRLQDIEEKVKVVQEKLNTRLVSQYRQLAALVCGTKWRLQTLKPQDTAAVVKKTRLELGAFDYRVKEQSELLTQYLLDLDGILSHGDTDIKNARKALVVFIQEQLLPEADTLKERSAKLKLFGEDVLNNVERQTLDVSMESENDAESDDMHVKALFDESEDESSESEEEEDDDEDEEDTADEEMEEPLADVKQDALVESDTKTDDSVADIEAKDEKYNVAVETDDEDEEQRFRVRKSPRLQPVATPQESNIDVSNLPVWRPYYQLQRRHDGIYLIARLIDIDPRNVRVQWNEYTGMLRVSGYRLPTEKDVVMSRLSGAPTFGRFEIVERFPRNMLNMQEATQQIMEKGILQIRMPYCTSRHPLRYHPTSFFQPQDCFVW